MSENSSLSLDKVLKFAWIQARKFPETSRWSHEDLVHEAVVRIYERLDSERSTCVGASISFMSRAAMIDFIRRQMKHRYRDEKEYDEGDIQEVDDRIDFESREMTDIQRQIVDLRFRDGLKWSEVAARTGMTVSNCAYHLRRIGKVKVSRLEKKELLKNQLMNIPAGSLRRVAFMHAILGYNEEDISDLTGLKLSSVKQYLIQIYARVQVPEQDRTSA